MRHSPRLTHLLLACALAVLAACARDTERWVQDLDAADPFTRRLAAAALGAGDRSDAGLAVRELLRHLGDNDPGVRQELVGALARVAPAAFNELIEKLGVGGFDEEPQQGALDAFVARAQVALLVELRACVRNAPELDPACLDPLLRRLDDAAVDVLADLLSEKDLRTRTHAARLLARSDANFLQAVPALCGATADVAGGSIELRLAAFGALAKVIDDPRAQKALRDAESDLDPNVRAAVQLTLRMRALVERLSAADPVVSKGALEEIAACGAAGLRALVALLADDDLKRARLAVNGLKLLIDAPPAGLEPTLLAFEARDADEDPAARALAWIARARGEPFDDEAIERGVGALGDASAAVRACAALALAAQRGGARAALPRLQELAQDDPEPVVRQVAGYSQERIARH